MCDYTRPRCGLPDIIEIKSRGELAALGVRVPGEVGDDPYRWLKPVVTWRTEAPKFRSAIAGAAWLWSAVCGITVREAIADEGADIIVTCSPIDGPYNRLAQAWVPGAWYGSTSADKWGDQQYDIAEEWDTEFVRLWVAIHEMGHSLGIGHSSDPGSIMSPYYTDQGELGAWDIEQAIERYGPPMDYEALHRVALIFFQIGMHALRREDVPDNLKAQARYLLQ